MQKKILFILTSLTTLALIFLLASCSDPYSGNYVEVTDSTELQQLVTNVQNVDATITSAASYEMEMSGSMKVSYEGFTTKTSFSCSGIVDSTNKRSYSKIKTSMSASGNTSGSLKATVEMWTDNTSNGMSYIDYDYSMKYAGESESDSKKIKGTLRDLDFDYGSEFMDIFSDFQPSRLVNKLDKSTTKVYADGNKIKLELKYDGFDSVLYFIVNEDSYQFKLEIPEVSQNGSSISESFEVKIKKSTKTVDMPKDEDFEEVSSLKYI